MSFSLTIPVSMSHHYVNSHYYGNSKPNYYQSKNDETQILHHQVLMSPNSGLDEHYHQQSKSSLDGAGHNESLEQQSKRAVPMRKQSVFVAPSGISSIRAPYLRPSLQANVPYTNQHNLLDCNQVKHSTRSVTESIHPIDLSDTSLSAQPYGRVRSTSESNVPSVPSNEDISQHISKLIQDNKAIIESYEPYPYFNHGRNASSKRSMSTTQLQTLVPSKVRLSTSSASNLTRPHTLSTYHSSQHDSTDNLQFRRYSSDVNAYSKLQSALLGEGKSPAHVPAPKDKSAIIRKYSENIANHPYQQFSASPHQPHYSPQSMDSYVNLYYNHRNNKDVNFKDSNQLSVIINACDHNVDFRNSVLSSLNESSRSTSEPSLVRNLLTSKTSSFLHLVSPEMSSNQQTTNSTPNANKDSSIIKDLLLKSRHSSVNSEEFNRTSPPVKWGCTESVSEQVSVIPVSSHSDTQRSSLLFKCKLCNVSFRNQQNLEVHQKFYCRGSDIEATKSHSNSNPQLKRKSCTDSPNSNSVIPQRKVSVLERPSIITYSNSESSSVSSVCPSPTGEDTHFGNILKSKLLSANTDISFESIKRRKISEPAFRYSYDSKHGRDSVTRSHRVSVVQSAASVKPEKAIEHLVEILPAYMPYLVRPATKITIKTEIVFPLLKKLVDTNTNHEFVVEDVTQNTSTDEMKMLFSESVSTDSMQIDGSDTEMVDLQSKATLLVKTNTQSQIESNQNCDPVHETLNRILQQVEFSLSDGGDESGQFNSVVSDCLSDIIDNVASGLIEKSETFTNKCLIARPTTLELVSCSYNQSARNQNETVTNIDQLRKSSKLSIFVNRCSNQDEENNKLNQLVASNLVSPDTPRPKRKYQQLFIGGNAYSNLGLKVTTRPTYCCIYRAQPMFVTQEANPQLSMYSKWKTYPVPSGDILEQVGTPHYLLSAYNSQEAVYAASQSRLSLVEMANAATIGGLEMIEQINKENKPSANLIRQFLDKITPRLQSFISSSPVKSKNENLDTDQPNATGNFDRTLRALVIPAGEGFSNRIIDTETRSQFLLTHSSYHSQSRSHPKYLKRNRHVEKSKTRLSSDLSETSNLLNSSTTDQTSTPNTEASTSVKARKRSSTAMYSSLSSTAFNPHITMHPILGHMPSKSKQTVMCTYIMMMSKTPPVLSIPNITQMASSKNFASRKFSENIGIRNPAIDDNWSTKIGPDGTTEYVPKRIKIFEGGFKSNEDYTYIRGRGRGKYVCEECGIRCKKPSMLKKHIRTHTDLRPYSCRHCAFAFKTKGNLTKHMKSKAHHKKCVELGIIPVPICIDDSQIDNEALAKQEQYELSCGSSNSLNQFADDDDDCDEDFDDEEIEEEDEEDDEGVPIPLIEQQRLTYIEPGQFDDVDSGSSNSEQLTLKLLNRTRKVSEITSASLSNTTSITGTCITSTLSASIPISIDLAESGVFNESITSVTAQASAIPISSSKMIMSSNQLDANINKSADTVSHVNLQNAVSAKSYHVGQAAINSYSVENHNSMSPSSQLNQNITQENEAEAARSLLILSGVAPNGDQSSFDEFSKSSGIENESQVNSSSSSTKLASASFKNSSVIVESGQPIAAQSSVHSPNSNSVDISPKSGCSKAINNDRVHKLSQDFTMSNEFMSRTCSTMEQTNTGHQTSVIMRHSPDVDQTSTRQEHANTVMEHGKPNTTPSYNLHSISSMITSSTPTHVSTLPVMPSLSMNTQMLQNYLRMSHEPNILKQSPQPPHALIVEEMKKRAIQHVGNDLSIQPLIVPNMSNQARFQKIPIPCFIPPRECKDSLSQHLHKTPRLNEDYRTSPIDTSQQYHKIVPSTLNGNHSSGHQMISNITITNATIPTSSSHNHISSAVPTNFPKCPNDIKRVSPSFADSNKLTQSYNANLKNMTSVSSRHTSSPLTKASPPTLTSCKASSDTFSQSNDQPIDLSKSSKVNIDNRQSPNADLSNSSSTPSPKNVNSPTSVQTSPSKYRYRPLIEQHHLTEQIARSFSHDISFLSKEPSQLHRNELYKNLRSEEFCHLAPGVHTPHRLPKNFQDFIGNHHNTPSAPTQSFHKSTSGYLSSEGKSTCPTCMKQFSKPSQLKLHLNIHLIERPFRCDSCVVSFRTKGHLQKHSRSTSHLNKLNMSITFGKPSSDNPRPFKCSDCKIAYRIHGHLAKHLRSKMHIMKLENSGKLPYGMFAEMERSNFKLNMIDTTDCEKALESLKDLAQKLYDPRQMSWKVPENFGQAMDDVIEEDVDEEIDAEMADDDQFDDSSDLSSEPNTDSNLILPCHTITSAPTEPNQQQNNSSNQSITNTSVSNVSLVTISTAAAAATTTTTSSISGIASTRSNTCHLCGKLFKAAKFLQVHLYCDHPEAAANEAVFA